jgi:hypothetical protein
MEGLKNSIVNNKFGRRDDEEGASGILRFEVYMNMLWIVQTELDVKE